MTVSNSQPCFSPPYTGKIRNCCTSATYYTSTYEEERPCSIQVRHSATVVPQKPCSTLQEQTNSCRGHTRAIPHPQMGTSWGKDRRRKGAPSRKRKEGERSIGKKGRSTHRCHMSPTVPTATLAAAVLASAALSSSASSNKTFIRREHRLVYTGGI